MGVQNAREFLGVRLLVGSLGHAPYWLCNLG